MLFMRVELLRSVALALLSLLVVADGGSAQEFDEEPIFKPIIAPTPTKKPTAAPAVFSFARFEPNFRLLCEELEADGRRERLVSIAVAETDRTDQTCISCRALWRSVIGGCAKLGARPTPRPKGPKGSPTPALDGGAVEGAGSEASEGGKVDSAEEGTPTPLPPTPSPTPKPKPRTPSTAAADMASRISIAAYSLDPGDGGVHPAFEHLVSVVLSTKDLTAAEREYFENLFTFLMAAWDGRDETEGGVRDTPAVDVDQFFEE